MGSSSFDFFSFNLSVGAVREGRLQRILVIT